MHKNEEIKNCLLVLMEECSEVQKVCSKIIRFGFNSYNPNDLEKIENWQKLSEEYGDLIGTMYKLDSLCPNTISYDYINLNASMKSKKIDKYFKISQEI